MGDETTTGDIIRTLLLGAPTNPGLVLPGRFGGHVGFDADDGLDTRVHGGPPHLVGTVHIAMVRDGHCRLALRLDLGDQVGDLRGPVQGGVMGVGVQVNEVRLGRGHTF